VSVLAWRKPPCTLTVSPLFPLLVKWRFPCLHCQYSWMILLLFYRAVSAHPTPFYVLGFSPLLLVRTIVQTVFPRFSFPGLFVYIFSWPSIPPSAFQWMFRLGLTVWNTLPPSYSTTAGKRNSRPHSPDRFLYPPAPIYAHSAVIVQHRPHSEYTFFAAQSVLLTCAPLPPSSKFNCWFNQPGKFFVSPSKETLSPLLELGICLSHWQLGSPPQFLDIHPFLLAPTAILPLQTLRDVGL